MNTNPNAVKVLCYGDSNTNGSKPDKTGRFGANERWTGLLQNIMGDGYYIIEEGLGGRTTDLEHYSPDRPSRNGLTYFKACIDSHMPLDIVLIMLGTNDLKTMYNRTAEDVASALRQYPDYITEHCKYKNPKQPIVILVSPAYMNENALRFFESMPGPGIYDEISAQKSRQFAASIKAVADEIGCVFFDAGPVTKTGEDGCHLDAESHKNLAENLANLISGLK